ncbi:MAG: DUF1343 domain-containing protein [Bacteroidales bacterium]|nr:DUF1343 domain-containing protein [Bacteroidales bacterium]MCB9012965.1 DUF1343 domain-containing protein [Bacteroidales bacterium]
MYRSIFLILIFVSLTNCSGGMNAENKLLCGADQTELYLPLLKNKRVGILANPTSRISDKYLVDTLLSLGVNLKKIFAAEHGFRGNVADGIVIDDQTDNRTGLPIVSLYGKNKKPSPEQLADIDIIIFDVQDVGLRFYTFISTLHLLMEACAENGKELLVLDRPNPNGNFIDGPVLDRKFESFIGMDPIPVVHGMTIAEVARMINGEGWLKNGVSCKLYWVPCKNYLHTDSYSPPVPPSPNLPNLQAIRLYPSLAFFEGTIVSEGRGTDFPFQVFGYPGFKSGEFTFTPQTIPGFANHPKFENQKCSGTDLRNYKPQDGNWDRINLEWLILAYNDYEDKEHFFKPYFEKLAGTDQLRSDIQEGKNAEEIRERWKPGLDAFRQIRVKYLIYK